MNKQEIIQTTNEVLAEEFEIENAGFVPDSVIKEALNLDSLGLVDMVALLEATFGIKIKGQEITSIKTFDELYGFLDARLNN